MFYHPFKKTVKSNSGKEIKKWYYWSKKADIFTSEELRKFFDGGNWVDGLREYLFFLVTARLVLIHRTENFVLIHYTTQELQFLKW